MSEGKMIYTGECRTCQKDMCLTIEAKEGTVQEKGKKRVRCSNCRDITHLPQTGAL